MKIFPTLYKKTNTGAIQQWQIAVFDSTIQTIHGQVDGKLQTTTDTIHEGKNLGKANATTPETQALAEAEAKWTKQLKKGYVNDQAAAEAGEVDAVIEGGIPPMLSPNKLYPLGDANLAKKIVFPAAVQPKLDGMRCIAIVENGICTLWTRTRKRIPTVPHIVEALEKMFAFTDVKLDGELYNHDYRNNFEDLMSILRGDEPDAEGKYLDAEYHVYDMPVEDMPFMHRTRKVAELLKDAVKPLMVVETRTVETQEQALQLQEKYEEQEYEGAMIRNMLGPYEPGRRSKHLQKMKTFVTDEFKITGAEDGRGKDAGTVAKFVCVTAEGKEFKPRLKATYARRRELMQHPEQWQGKVLTVRYKRMTADGKPYIPIGMGIRDYE